MILSVSRRTDIPACYFEWFLTRIREGSACVRNPINPRQISRISLSPQVVDCIVFWSKNPEPVLLSLDKLGDYMYYFQFTLNAYGRDLETHLPLLEQRLETFQALSSLLGPERVLWRYDPVLINQTYTVPWHISQFSRLARLLSGYTKTCTISFIDSYAAISRAMKSFGIEECTDEIKRILAREFSEIARSHRLTLITCAEEIDLSSYHIGHAHCIDSRLIEQLLGCSMDVKKDKNQRPACGCAESIDLGSYNTCKNGCIYCYANHSSRLLEQNGSMYDPASPLLCSRLTEADKVCERKVKRSQNPQLRLPTDE